jgi:hypothetical protein
VTKQQFGSFRLGSLPSFDETTRVTVVVILVDHLHERRRVHDDGALLGGPPDQPIVVSSPTDGERWDISQ